MTRKKPSESSARRITPSRRRAIVLRRGLNKYAVAAWRGDENGEPVYEVAREDVLDVSVAATLARPMDQSV